MKTLNLTDEQASTLQVYLLASTKYREGEENACKELGREINEDGSLKFPNMKANGEWWKEANKTLKDIIAEFDITAERTAEAVRPAMDESARVLADEVTPRFAERPIENVHAVLGNHPAFNRISENDALFGVWDSVNGDWVRNGDGHVSFSSEMGAGADALQFNQEAEWAREISLATAYRQEFEKQSEKTAENTHSAVDESARVLATDIVDFLEKHDPAFGYAEGLEGQRNRDEFINTFERGIISGEIEKAALSELTGSQEVMDKATELQAQLDEYYAKHTQYEVSVFTYEDGGYDIFAGAFDKREDAAAFARLLENGGYYSVKLKGIFNNEAYPLTYDMSLDEARQNPKAVQKYAAFSPDGDRNIEPEPAKKEPVGSLHFHDNDDLIDYYSNEDIIKAYKDGLDVLGAEGVSYKDVSDESLRGELYKIYAGEYGVDLDEIMVYDGDEPITIFHNLPDAEAFYCLLANSGQKMSDFKWLRGDLIDISIPLQPVTLQEAQKNTAAVKAFSELNKQKALENLQNIKAELPPVMSLNKAEGLFDALSECYHAGCTNAEINKAMYSEMPSVVAQLTEIEETHTANTPQKDAAAIRAEGGKAEGFTDGQLSAEREIISRLYRAGASDKMLQSARVNLSEAEYRRHITSLQRDARNAPEAQPPNTGINI